MLSLLKLNTEYISERLLKQRNKVEEYQSILMGNYTRVIILIIKKMVSDVNSITMGIFTLEILIETKNMEREHSIGLILKLITLFNITLANGGMVFPQERENIKDATVHNCPFR
jgi:hypothetical protein